VDPPTREPLPGGPTPSAHIGLLWLLVGVTVAPVVVALVAATTEPWLPTADNAILALRTLDVPSRLPLTGAYSRYGFDHPGPFQFYLLSPFLSLLGPRGMLVGAGAVATLSTGGAVVVAWRRGGLALAVLASAILLLLTRALADDLVDPWNPLTPVLPFFALALLTWAVTCRDWWALPFALAAASFAAQTHIAYIPLAGALAATAIGWAVVDRWQARKLGERCDWRPISNVVAMVSLVVVVVAWFPPLVDQFRAGGGNLGEMARYFVSGAETTDDPYFVGTERPTLGDTIGIVSRQLGVVAPWSGAAEPVDFSTGGVSPAPMWHLALPLGLSILGAIVAAMRRSFEALRLQAIVGALALIGLVAVSRVTGGVYPYLVRWLWVIGALVTLSAVWSLVAGSRIERALLGERVPWLLTGALAVVAGLSAVSLARTEAPDPDLADATRAVVVPILDLVDVSGSERVEVVPGPLWEPAAISTGLIAELQRQGVTVTVPDTPVNRLALRPERTAPEGSADLRLVVVTGPDAVAPGSIVVVDHDPLTPQERAELDRIAARVPTFEELGDLPDGLADRLQELSQRGRGRVVVVRDPA
jgi:hypothetical protein